MRVMLNPTTNVLNKENERTINNCLLSIVYLEKIKDV